MSPLLAATIPIVAGAPEPRSLPIEGKIKGDVADVVVETPDATCRLQRAPITSRSAGEVQVKLGVQGDALATWASGQGTLSAVAADGSVPPCDLPDVDTVVVPAGGWAIGVHHPAVELHVDGPVTVLPLGDDAVWWHVVATSPGEADLAVVHAQAPPTRLRLVLDPGARPPEGTTVAVGRRGAVEIPLDAPVVAWSVPDDAVASVVALGGHLVAFGHATGRADGIVREEGLVPEPVSVVVLPDLAAPVGPGWALDAGASRKLKPDVPIVEAVSADPEVVRVSLKSSKVLLTAGPCAECEADVVLLDAAGQVHVVRVVVH
jgi:hypothetical protein